MAAIGGTIRRARRKKGLTQRQLGEMTGYKDTYIAKIELGQQRGSLEALTKIADALELPRQVVYAEFGINHNRAAPQFAPEDYDFQRLPPKLKAIVMEIAETIYKADSEIKKGTQS